MADLLKSGHDRPPRRWIGMAAAVVLLAGAGLYGALHESSDSLEPAPAPVSTESAAPPAISHRALGKPILGITGKWELFGRNVHSVVRVRPAKGLITRTTVPQSSGSGPVSFLVTGDRAIVRPFDRVDGFFVPDNGNQRTGGSNCPARTMVSPSLTGPDIYS